MAEEAAQSHQPKTVQAKDRGECNEIELIVKTAA